MCHANLLSAQRCSIKEVEIWNLQDGEIRNCCEMEGQTFTYLLLRGTVQCKYSLVKHLIHRYIPAHRE